MQACTYISFLLSINFFYNVFGENCIKCLMVVTISVNKIVLKSFILRSRKRYDAMLQVNRICYAPLCSFTGKSRCTVDKPVWRLPATMLFNVIVMKTLSCYKCNLKRGRERVPQFGRNLACLHPALIHI